MRPTSRSRVGSSTLGGFAVVFALALAILPAAGGAHAVTPSVATPYSVTFSETGLPHGTNWSVHVAFVGCSCDGVYRTVTSNQTTLAIPVTNGTYQFHVRLVPGFYVNVGASGMFNVTGSNVSGPAFSFHPLIPYATTFSETGLPNATLWSVSVTGNGTGQLRTLENQRASSVTGSLTFALPNGSYHYVVANVPGSFFLNHSSRGTFVVAGGSPPPVPVRFTTPPLFAVHFTESGLANGTNWSVRVAGWGGVAIRMVLSSTTPNLTFQLPNGTYRFVVAQVMGFVTTTPASGPLTVTNTSQALAVGFRTVAPGAFYPVAFQESGLGNGTHWSVTVTILQTFGHSRTATQSSNGATLFFLLQNNSYKFVVHTPRGYAAVSGSSGSIQVAGSSPSVFLVNFSLVPTFTVTISETGLANGTNWSALVRSQTVGSTPWPIRLVQVGNTSALTFAVPNGTYCYRVYAVAGYVLSTGMAAGTLVVAGAPTSVAVGFTP